MTFRMSVLLLSCFLMQNILHAEAPDPLVENDIAWHDISRYSLEGRGWSDTSTPFSRMPLHAKEKIPGPVWNLSLHSAGLSIRFKTNATTIHARHGVGGNLTMAHMTTVGSSGLDLYSKDDQGRWRWAGFSKPTGKKYEDVLLQGIPAKTREFLLYLPLYNSTESLSLGVPKGSSFEIIAPEKTAPVVYYGTSIAHGCSASRPGMAFPSILSRRLGVPILNLGFSGNGRMEAEMADLIAEIDASVYVIDCIPNMSPQQINERSETFLRRLRQLKPRTPILLVEDRTYSHTWIKPSVQELQQKKRAAFRTVYEKLTKEGMTGLTYLEGANLLGDDDESTVDGSHPTDVGMVQMADAVEPLLRNLLENKNSK